MSQNYDHLTKAHRLRSLADLIEREPRLMAELEQLGAEGRIIADFARAVADELDQSSVMKE